MPIGVSPLSIKDKILSTSSKDAISVEWYGGPQVPPTLMQVQKHLCIFRNIMASAEILMQAQKHYCKFRNINASSETLMQVQKTFMQVRLKTFMHVQKTFMQVRLKTFMHVQ